MLERDYQAKLIKKIKKMVPGCEILKTDPNYIQGFPDLLILHQDKWAALEVKKSAKAHRQPNQQYYVDKLNQMGYASFIFPQNEQEVLHEIQHALEPGGSARVSEREQLPLAEL